jgi:dihydroorotase
VHLREPGYEYKEDFDSGTAAALAGGVVTMLDMPNTQPPTSTPTRLAEKAALARKKARCDVGLFVGATSTEPEAYLPAARQACGLKIYVSDTFGSLRIESLDLMHRFFRSWAEQGAARGYRTRGERDGIGPIAVHAEELMLPVCLNLSHLYDVPLHVVHVTRAAEIELIAQAKARGYPVTCEATPHHLFLDANDAARLGPLGDMRPRLAAPSDVTALWAHLEVIDIFATDHAPHTREEKHADNPPPGVPGVETMLPLLLTAVHAGRLELDDVVLRCVERPRAIYGLAAPADTYVEVDVDAEYGLKGEELHTRIGWTPFEGMSVRGRVERVILRGVEVFGDGKVKAEPGFGQVLFVTDEAGRTGRDS